MTLMRRIRADFCILKFIRENPYYPRHPCSLSMSRSFISAVTDIYFIKLPFELERSNPFFLGILGLDRTYELLNFFQQRIRKCIEFSF